MKMTLHLYMNKILFYSVVCLVLGDLNLIHYTAFSKIVPLKAEKNIFQETEFQFLQSHRFLIQSINGNGEMTYTVHTGDTCFCEAGVQVPLGDPTRYREEKNVFRQDTVEFFKIVNWVFHTMASPCTLVYSAFNLGGQITYHCHIEEEF
jgi:hypothetical protein